MRTALQLSATLMCPSARCGFSLRTAPFTGWQLINRYAQQHFEQLHQSDSEHPLLRAPLVGLAIGAWVCSELRGAMTPEVRHFITKVLRVP
jgi:hypothetical protein